MGQRTAILIGNGLFTNEPGLPRLYGPRNDVRELQHILADPAIGGFQVKSLVDASSGDILRCIEEVFTGARPDDFLLLYYSGHGKLNPRGQLCLCTTNTTLRAIQTTTVPLSSIRELYSDSRCRHLTILLDCCFSGAAADAFTLRSGNLADQFTILSRATGLHILTSSSAEQVSLEPAQDQTGMGAFTACVVEGLASGAADRDGDGQITLIELKEYADERLQRQTPQYTGVRTESFPVIALSKGRRASPYEQRLVTWYSTDVLPADVYRACMATLQGTAKTDREKAFHELLVRILGDDSVGPSDLIIAWRNFPVTDSEWLEQQPTKAVTPERRPDNFLVPALMIVSAVVALVAYGLRS